VLISTLLNSPGPLYRSPGFFSCAAISSSALCLAVLAACLYLPTFLSVSLLSLIFCPTSFRREWAAFLAWCPPPAFRNCFVEVSQHLNDLLVNLLGRKWSPGPIPPPSWDHPLVGPICYYKSKSMECPLYSFIPECYRMELGSLGRPVLPGQTL